MNSVNHKITWGVQECVLAVRIASICLILIPAVFLVLSCRPHMTVEQIDQLIATEAPRGSSKSQVNAFLNSHKIEHSVYLDDPETSSDFRYYLPDSKKPLIKGYVTAIIRNVHTGRWEVFTRRNLQMHFYFDERGNLVEYTLNEIGTKS
jgi:hypothetical protein